jgi:pyrroloquinoline quinone (PQQ) biosynthesis protein C
MQIMNTTSLAELIDELRRHPVNSNHFFERFRDEYLQPEQLQAWFRQYHYFCKHFVKMLEGLLYAAPIDEVEMRVELIKTLHSELGSGSIERAHVQLLERFGRALRLEPSESCLTEPIPEVKAYLMTLRRLFWNRIISPRWVQNWPSRQPPRRSSGISIPV